MAKKSILLTLAAIMLITLAACSSNSNNGGQRSGASSSPENGAEATQAPAETADPNAEAIQKGTYKFDPPVTITTVKATDGTFKFKNGENLDNNVHTKWALEELGIQLKNIWESPGDQFATKVRLMLTSKETLPDVLMTEDMTLINELIQSGHYRDITADFETYASPEMKELYSSHPLMWSQVTHEGKKMALPNFAHAGNDNGVLWIRQDWLDELGLKAPTTFEELESVMQAFVDKKPGGANNIIPLGLSLGAGGNNPNPFAGWLGESTWVFGPYGTIPYQWLEKDGQLIHGSTLPEMKDGLARLNDWYNKGYISQEAGLHDENKLAELIGQGRVGMVVAPYWLPNWPIPDLKKNVEGADMLPYPLPTLNGKSAARDTTFLRGGLLVKQDFEHVDALFLYLNRIFGRVTLEPGSEFENGWAKDYDYTILADGSVSVAEEDIPGGKVGVSKYVLIDLKNPFTNLEMLANVSRGVEPKTSAEKRAALTNLSTLKAAEIVDDGWKNGFVVSQQFTGAPTPAMQSKSGILVKLEGDTFISMIYGKKPIDDFDNFVKEWKSIGGDDITKEANEWYQKTK
ncbi:extracellular solute-binding protein [Paenibacillus sp. LHD-117]|uniref:extracellular solute-binding protein n=1 Tax=Paenibacillus sp. LHD-117 TaxID=3071412 RepID=UPI0027DFF0DF|nr:extracellular solute-binding protein [Paenibacillus sp. LHD-117]MDQ6419883.1 extracellular solute-binding protein [Paenibacillus sp. LHD-117]